MFYLNEKVIVLDNPAPEGWVWCEWERDKKRYLHWIPQVTRQPYRNPEEDE